MEEIYKDLNSPKSKEFEKLLNSEFSKSPISGTDISVAIIDVLFIPQFYLFSAM